MMGRKLAGSLAAVSLAVSPIIASAAPINPAQTLSISGVRTGSDTTLGRNHLSGRGVALVAGLLIIGGIAAILIIDGTSGHDRPDSP